MRISRELSGETSDGGRSANDPGKRAAVKISDDPADGGGDSSGAGDRGEGRKKTCDVVQGDGIARRETSAPILIALILHLSPIVLYQRVNGGPDRLQNR